MAEFNRLPTQAELDRILFQQSLGNKTTQQIINENLAGGGFTNQDNVMQRMATGAGIAKQAVNKLGNAADIAKLFPGYTGQTKVNIPTGYNFAPKMDPYSGQVGTQGLQTQSIPYGDILKAIKPADVLGISGAESVYSDIGAGKAPQPMDVVDTLGLGAGGLAAGKGLLGAGVKTAKYAAPAAGRMLEQYASDTGLLSPLIAYHGTPHSFDKFDISKVGTGEGAQAYGHGIYFAESPELAKTYKKTTSYQNVVRQFVNELPEDADFGEVIDLANSGKLSAPMSDVIKELGNNDWLGFDYPSQAINAAFRNGKNFDMSPELVKAIQDYGNIYKVDIPDSKIATFLDWDKKISDQKQIKDAFNKINDKYNFGYDNNYTGRDFYKGLTVDFIRTGKAKNEMEAQKLVSDELNNLGVGGVRYLDAVSRGAKDGTSNFVVFDPSTVKMLERNNEPMQELLK